MAAPRAAYAELCLYLTGSGLLRATARQGRDARGAASGPEWSGRSLQREQLVNRLIDPLGEPVGVGGEVGLGVDVEAGATGDGGQTDRDSAPCGERHDGVEVSRFARSSADWHQLA